MADALTDEQVKGELNPDEFEMMFLQTAEGKGPEPVVPDPVVEEAKVEPEPAKAEEIKVEPAKVEEAKTEPAKVATPEPVKVVAPEPVKVEPAPVIEYTAEELADLESVKKDFPEITKVLAAQERLLTEKFGALLQAEVAKVQQNLAPVFASAEQQATSAFKAAVAQKHADAETLLPDAEAWITTQPKFLQDAYNRVLDNGTVAEVVEFFTTFKAATGRTEAAVTPPPAVDPAVAAEKAKKLASQEGVKNVRTPSRKDNGPLDFETAFNQVA